ncbi:MAG: hypothetical protein LUD77_10060, partial [Clostridiales bacterium]|nr:hypothetical protein [Clostridiales bacterium]
AKRFLSTILALTMLCSCMVVMNISTVFAADYTDYGSVKTSADLTTRTWDFSLNMPDGNISCSAGDTVLGIVVDEVTSRFRISSSSSPYLSIYSAKFSIPVPVGSAGTITLTNQSTVSDRYLQLTDTETTKSLSSSGQAYEFTAEDTGDGYLQFAETDDKEAKIQGIEVVVTNNVSYPEDTSVTYTINGTTNLASTSITVGTYEVKTDADGAYTIEKTVEEGADAPFADGDVLAVTAIDYDSQNATLTVVPETDSTVFTASEVTLTKYTLTALGNGSYTSFLLPDFEPGSDLVATASDRSKFTGSMSFILDSAKEVTFKVSCGSSTTTKCASFTLKDSGGTEIYATDYIYGGSGSTTKSVYLEAGTYTIVGDDNDTGTTLQIGSITVNPIAIFGVTAAEAENSAFNIVAGDTELLAADADTVYTGIAFDSGTKTADEFVSGASYVIAYVVELSDNNSIDDLKISFK